MTHFAAQLQACKSELNLLVESAETDEERFGIAAMYCFRSAVAILFQAREIDRSPEQYLSSCGYVTIANEYLRKSKVNDSIWKRWPRRKVPLGQYHFSGAVSSALGLTVQFSKGMYAEISLARLTAFPNQNIEVKELPELREWRETLWLQLKTNRPELSDWPLWSLHQWRDETIAQLRSEYEEFADIQASDYAKQRVETTGEFVAQKNAEIDSANESELLRTASVRLMSFFHRWRRMPKETEGLEFNGTVGLSSALPHFVQEFDPLMRCLWRCQRIASQRNMACAALDELVAMLRHCEVVEAIRLKFRAVAELDRLRNLIECKVVHPKQEIEPEQTPKRSRADPKELVQELERKIAKGYKYHKSTGYKKLIEDFGGSAGTWSKIFADPENAKLKAWTENKSVSHRNYESVDQAIEDDAFIPDDELESTILESIRECDDKEAKAEMVKAIAAEHPELVKRFISRSQ